MAIKTGFRDLLVRIVAIVGLLAVLLLGAWGIIQLAFFLPTFFGNIGSGIGSVFRSEPAKEALTVSAPMGAKAGEALTLSWTHNNKEKDADYTYAISYSCAEGLSMQAPLPSGSAQSVACNTPFNYTSADASLKLTPVLSGTKNASTTFAVTATKLSSGSVTAQGSTATNVSPTAAPTTSGTKKPTSSGNKPSSTYVASGYSRANLYGYPDLRVSIITNPGVVKSGTRVALQFVIENVGTNATGQGWGFTALLPYVPTYTYTSVGQQILYPGDKIVYTLGYDAIYQNQSQQYPYGGTIYPNYSTQTVTITVDPANMVPETNEANNTASVNYNVY